ncbi:hypothetical protein SETIT_9G199100v2 [Setaria italica]|uniref:RNase H type-1 domain-containing protein n=1 Tax=Setaria italica TaxID=4555 RepID=K4AK82_SETIT|nr:hypothetical protein SETIT_9G199100v2 [Setaria italica]
MRDKYEMGATGSSSSAEGERGIWKKVWSAAVPSKLRVFAWKVVRNGLPTRANKDMHVVLPTERDLRNVGPDWLLMILDRYDVEVCSNFLMLIWTCWNVRNNVLQAGEGISIAGSVLFLTRYIEALLQIRQQNEVGDARGKQKLMAGRLARASTRRLGSDSKWTPPIGQAIKFNVDGAFIKETGKAAVGVIVRYGEGHPLLTDWRWLRQCRDAEEAEALACLEGIRMASRWPDRAVILESDCSTVIGKLRVEGLERSLVAPIILDIRGDASHLQGVSFVKIRREQNRVTHELAHLAIRTSECRVSFADVPECTHQSLVYSKLP